MALSNYLRRKLEGKLIDFHSDRIAAEAESIVYEGGHFKGLRDYTDEELLEDYAYIFGCDEDEEIYVKDDLYQMCLAELGVNKLITG